MESNPFDIDIVDSFASGVPESDRLILHGEAFDVFEGVLGEMREEEIARRRAGDVKSGRGRLLLVESERAGYGKTHFLARARGALCDEYLMAPLSFGADEPVGWGASLRDFIDYCGKEEAPSGGMGLLEELARRVFADLTAQLIRSGAIPAPNSDEALSALTGRPLEVFDFSHREGEVVEWFCRVFETLLGPLAAGAARRYGIRESVARFWLAELYAYCLEMAEGGRQGEGLERFCRDDGDASGGCETAAEKFTGLGKLLCRWRPVIFIADHLDANFGEVERGREIASMLVELPVNLPNSLTVLSVNRDVWESIFRGTLPGAIEDRLTANAIRLGGISIEEGSELVEGRLADWGISDDVTFRFLPCLGLDDFFGREGIGDPSPRELLRHARERWDLFAASGHEAPPEPVARESVESPVPPPAMEEFPAAPAKEEKGERKGDEVKTGIEFISLSGGNLEPMDESFDPLEPLKFEQHLSLRPRRYRVPRPEDDPPPGEPAPGPAATMDPEFDFSAWRKESGEEKGQEEESASPEQPSPEENREEGATPQLEDTVNSLVDEAMKAFGGFQEIFKEAYSDEPAAPRDGPDPADGNRDEGESEAGVESASAGDGKAAEVAEDVVDVAAEYNRLRQDALVALEPGDFDLVRFYAVLSAVGELFPVVVQSEFDLPSNPGYRVLEWANENQRIFFGLLAVENGDYWCALTDYARRFLSPENDEPRNGRERSVKVVVLTPASEPLGPESWRENPGGPGGEILSIDDVLVDRETVAAFYAAARMIDTAREPGSSRRVEDVLRFVSRELDYFWRRLTRGNGV